RWSRWTPAPATPSRWPSPPRCPSTSPRTCSTRCAASSRADFSSGSVRPDRVYMPAQTAPPPGAPPCPEPGAVMPIRSSARIHPTAVIAPEAELADGVEVGPYAVLEGPVRLGPGCVVRPHAHLIGPLTMGRGNTVFTGAVLGERPQHLKYNGEPTSLEVG